VRHVSSSRRISVARHDLDCAALRGGTCGCEPETSTERYTRVCAHCGRTLTNRRRPYCSLGCRQDARVGAKDLAERQRRDDEYRAR
jgi:hypothetical protein